MKILIALDGSEGATLARDLVVALPLPDSTEVHLVAVYQVPTDWAPELGAGLAWIDDAETAMQETLHQTLGTLAAPFVAAGMTPIEHVVRGRAATAICDVARSIGADLVVTGSRGRGVIAATLLGSVAAEVATHAPCPVLVARGRTVSRLLVATDGSRSAEHIPDRLGAWGFFRGLPADVVAVSISDTPTFELIVGLYTLGDDRLADKRRNLHERFRQSAEAMSARLSAIGIPATAHVRNGDVAHEILHAARDHGADLVITGSRGLGALDRLLLGSVARNVLTHFGGSVLIMREAEPA
ncbi:MAG TPA: universal stress protein [Patescibacteria group bacterium]|nr:universal stress protein [Patescibacteria group bacterium]